MPCFKSPTHKAFVHCHYSVQSRFCIQASSDQYDRECFQLDLSTSQPGAASNRPIATHPLDTTNDRSSLFSCYQHRRQQIDKHFRQTETSHSNQLSTFPKRRTIPSRSVHSIVYSPLHHVLPRIQAFYTLPTQPTLCWHAHPFLQSK